jgi:ABC-type Zn uptake system ZnuABC Zn-binding protein ZnuA
MALALLAAVLLATGCAGQPAGVGESDPAAPLALPPVTPAALDGRPLRVVATTSIIGDVVAHVGGPAIDLTTLMAPGQDPHSYQPGAADLAVTSEADLIFVNGWGLEGGLVDDLATIARNEPIPVSAGIVPLLAGAEEHEAAADEDHAHEGPDPHVWQDVSHVIRWVETIEATLSAADPANAPLFATNAAAYRATLAALDEAVRTELAAVPPERRVLVTNHDTFAYFAAAYDFHVLGSVIPAASTLAEPTAANLAELAAAMSEAGVCSLFVETTADDQLAQTLRRELDGCDEVRVLTLYSDALGPPGSGADSYEGLVRANVATLLEGLNP